MATEKMVLSDIPDFADIQSMENSAYMNDPKEYAKKYHKLATQYGEDIIDQLVEQYHTGPAW